MITAFCTGFRPGLAQESAPLVARLEMKLALNQEVVDVIEKGDLLTLLSERENSFVIQTFNGQKGAVAKVNVARLAESVPIYDDLIEERPDEGRLYTLRASAAWAAGNPKQALADYDKAIELGYEEAHAYASRGLFHAATGQYEPAVADYSRAIEKDPKDDVPLLNRAGALISLGRYEDALQDYTRAIELRPENPVLYSQRAVAYKLLNQLDRALADYDQTIELSEKDVSAWMGRGFIKFQLDRFEDAIEDFSQAIQLAPQSAVAFNNRGYNYQQLGEFELAAKDYKRAVELAPNYLLALQNRAWLLTICTDESVRNPVEGIELAKAVCEISEYRDVSDLTLLAASYASAGEFAAAIGWQEKAIELADEAQQPISKKILELYQSELPLDPRLLNPDDERPPSPRTTRAAS